MTNLLDDLVYVTLADARETSATLALITDDDVLTNIITQAQWIIDWYIGSYGIPAVDWQSFIFPIEDDWTPTDIQLATIRVSEFVSTNGATFNTDKIVSENNLSRSVSFSDKQSYYDYVKTVGIPKRVINILDRYKNDFIWQVI